MLKNFNKLSKPKFLNNFSFVKYNKLRFTTNLTTESFANGSNVLYIENLYSQWLQNPESVHISWQNYFTNVDKGFEPGLAFQPPPTIDPSKSLII